jgi:hypothetical protein
MTLVAMNSIILHDNARAHTSDAVKDLFLPLAIGDTGTSAILNQYEPMRL